MFRAHGWEVTGDQDFADAYVINTCTVTAVADKKSRQYIRRMKRINPDSVIAVTGCYVQISPDEVKGIDGVDIVTGTNEKGTLIDYVEEALRQRNAEMSSQRNAVDHTGGPVAVIHDYGELGVFEEMGVTASTENRTRAYIKVQEGCSRFCSYCVIPYARGPVRSRALEDIIAEAKALIDAGYRELVLTGINTAMYDMEGRDLYSDQFEAGSAATGGASTDGDTSAEPFGIERAIAAIDGLPGDFRIRLSSLEPAVVNADYVKRLLKYGKLCHHLHMSVQSGSDRVLEAMNRPYDVSQYMEMVGTLRAFDPCFGISTDIIVGFPGEKEQDFEESCRLTEECAFCKTHIFKYSKRPKTKAAEMKDQVSPQIKQKRSDALQKIGGQAARDFFYTNIVFGQKGRTETVLFEEIVPAPEEEAGILKGEGLLTGYTGNYIRVYVPVRGLGDAMLGKFAKVRLEAIYCDGIAAVVVQ